MASDVPLTGGADLRDEEEVGQLAVRLANSIVLPMALKSALELNLIEIIAAAGDGAFLSPAEIAAQLPDARNPEAPVMLDRVLRLLASYSILRCSLRTLENGEVERSYGAGPICKFLTISRNHPDDDGDHQGRSCSFAPLFLLHHDKVFTHSWYQLKEAILEGGNPFERANGMTIFEYPRKDERFKRVFQEAMSNHTSLIMKKILEIYKGFEGLKMLVDVGGGTGDALATIISKYYPHMKGINYELPLVLVDAPSYLGVEHVGGDMFESVPKGDAIFMKWILHGWKDDECVRILRNCFEALPKNGKVIVVESILPTVPEYSVSSHISFKQDVLMLAQSPSGKERTQKEYEALAINSGFSGCKPICSAYNSWVMEFHKNTTTTN